MSQQSVSCILWQLLHQWKAFYVSLKFKLFSVNIQLLFLELSWYWQESWLTFHTAKWVALFFSSSLPFLVYTSSQIHYVCFHNGASGCCFSPRQYFVYISSSVDLSWMWEEWKHIALSILPETNDFHYQIFFSLKASS